VLIADDNPTSQRILASILSARTTTVLAGDGEVAWRDLPGRAAARRFSSSSRITHARLDARAGGEDGGRLRAGKVRS